MIRIGSMTRPPTLDQVLAEYMTELEATRAAAAHPTEENR